MSPLINEAKDLVQAAEVAYAGTPAGAEIAAIKERLYGPLRIAIAGKVKAGKSTLLNALVGARLAPTDAGECTRIVTWYRNGTSYDAHAQLVGGEVRRLHFEAAGDDFQVSLAGLNVDDVQQLFVDWPSRSLENTTLIDTPGVGSLSKAAAQRSVEFLSDDHGGSDCDAVLYLMKHLHGRDVELLRSFHDNEVSHPNPVNAIGILSRADEIGAGRLDAMDSARRVAARIANDPAIQKLVSTVVPIVGLLAETAMTLTEAEYRHLRALASLPVDQVDARLMSADRFVGGWPESDLSSDDRKALLRRFGIFGVRSTTDLIRSGRVATSTQLAHALLRLSGLDELRRLLDSIFMQRGDVLKARSALLGVERVLGDHASDAPAVQELERTLERVMASAHEFAELRLLGGLRAGWVEAKPDVLLEIERLIGASGYSSTSRLGLAASAEPLAIESAAADALARWQRRAEHPLTKPNLVTASRVVIRSCEALMAGTRQPRQH